MNAVDRFWSQVDKSGECWLWTGLQHRGYGRSGMLGQSMAHRVAYLLEVGPIPEGLQLDHLCEVKNCVRPTHLEPVTNAENMRRSPRGRRTHCDNGHEFTPENTLQRVDSDHRYGKRCRACRREYERQRYHGNVNPRRVILQKRYRAAYKARLQAERSAVAA